MNASYRLTILAGLILGCSLQAASFRFEDLAREGAVAAFEGDQKVLEYRYGLQLESGVPSDYRRACYIHPLYSLDGNPLTEDFPKDHYHHRGVFWTWPRMKVGSRPVQTWLPSGIHQVFGKWIRRDASGEAAALEVENEWKLDWEDTVAKERVSIRIHPATSLGRAIDFELTLTALNEPIELLGAEQKGYGGLCIRAAPALKGATMTTDAGVLKEDSLRQKYRWADLSNESEGLAVLVPPVHPDFPPEWLIRNSYGGVLNVAWPGVEPFTLEKDRPLTLRYRIYIHRGDAEEGRVAEAYAAYVGNSEGHP